MRFEPQEGHDTDLAKRLAFRTSLVVVLLITAFVYIYAGGPPFPSTTPEQGDWAWRAAVVLMMLIGGALGGCLYNFRGIAKHTEHQDFFAHYELTYLLRPLSAAICGIFVFALVYGGVLTLTLGQKSALIDHRSVILYLAIALLAGYGSHEFLRKVKDLNRTLFALSEAERLDDIKERTTERKQDEAV